MTNVVFLLLFKLVNTINSGFLTGFALVDVSEFIRSIALPFGFSYITFQNISYLVDVKKEFCEPETSYLNYAIYSLFFPKIAVGPIMRYKQMAPGIKHPEVNISRMAEGLRRFIIGLSKKVLIADTIARVINPSFDLPSPEFSTGIAWFMIIGYTVQLYYDFSGFTDMAIGIGEILGISLVENFNFPYIAESISDFWRRWHISLSSWVRDYVFMPLEFKRRRAKFARQQAHIMLAFFVVGLWHGLTPNYIAWGVLNGIFLALEITFLAKILKRSWRPIRHIYTISFLLISWTFFRSNNLTYTVKFLGRLLGIGSDPVLQSYLLTSPLPIIDHSVWIALIFGIILSAPTIPLFIRKFRNKPQKSAISKVGYIFYDFVLVCLFIFSIVSLTSSTAVRNIYGGF